MTPLQQILAAYRATSQTEREKGTYFSTYTSRWTIYHFQMTCFPPPRESLGYFNVSTPSPTPVSHISSKPIRQLAKAARSPRKIMERQAVTTNKDSGITNEANLWDTETMGNAKYPLELFLRVVTVSLETNRVVAGLPRLDIDSK